MADASEIKETNPRQLLGLGRRHLAVKDYNAAAETLATACELLAKEYSDTADQLAEPYLWYGKALLGLSREEAGVFGDKVPVITKKDDEDEEEDNDDEVDDCDEEEQNGDDVESKENGVGEDKGTNDNGDGKKPEVSAKEEQSEAGVSAAGTDDEKPGPSNGEANESTVDLDNDEEVDNLQHAWEMLELSRSILEKRVSGGGGGEAARAVLAEAHLALGEVALESETYDKAVLDLQKCLEIQQDIYHSDNRRIAETHYQIGLANSLASNFEDAITHFKAAANILETRIKNLENPDTAAEDSTVKKYVKNDPLYTVAAEIKEIKELLPEIKEKIQDMLDYKAETIKRVHETLAGTNGSQSAAATNGAGSGVESAAKPAASDISHLVKRKRKSSEGEPPASAAKRVNAATDRC